jgi:hypothetical protein
MPFNVFVSWSGPLSRRVAAIVHEWLPTAVQAADPFLSDENIEAGARWLPEISNRLASIKIGLLCVTSDNQLNPWLNFEAGALAKTVNDDTRVIPLAFDLEKSHIRNPLGQFNAKMFTEEDIFAVVKTINRALEQPLTEQRLKSAFDLSWPVLNTKIEHLRSEIAQQPLIEEEQRGLEEMVEQLIEESRAQRSLLTSMYSRLKQPVSDMHANFSSTVAALNQLGQYYEGGKQLTAAKLLKIAPDFDDEDWSIVENAPFLNWYLTQLHRIQRPRSKAPDPLDEVPF